MAESALITRLGNQLALRFVLPFAPTAYQRLKFRSRMGYWPDLSTPSTISEHLLKLKLSLPEDGALARYTDKLAVRTFIEERRTRLGLAVSLPEIVAIASDPADLDIEAVSDIVFVKTNHGSGTLKKFDPETDDPETVRRFIRAWSEVDYARAVGETSYVGIEPKVFIEKALQHVDGSLPVDIKLHCYFGKVAFIQVVRRTGDQDFMDIYDADWNRVDWFGCPPINFDTSDWPKRQLVELAEQLSDMADVVRVDLYFVEGSIYFGELTFFPNAGMMPLKSYEVDLALGSLFERYRESYSRIKAEANRSME